MSETVKSTPFIAVLSRRHDGRGDLDWQSVTNVECSLQPMQVPGTKSRRERAHNAFPSQRRPYSLGPKPKERSMPGYDSSI